MSKLSSIWLAAALLGIGLGACDQQEQAPEQQQPVVEEPVAVAAAPQPVATPQPEPQPEPQPVPHAQAKASVKIECEDLSYKMPNMVPLIQQLRQAATYKDVRYIEDALDDDVKFNFGGGFGKDAFLKEWQLDGQNPERSDFWLEFKKMLDLGGYVQRSPNGAPDTIIFPCSFKELPKDNWIAKTHPKFGPFEYGVVTLEGAILADDYGDPIRKLAMNETLYTPSGINNDAYTHDGLHGFANVNDIRSPIDYRMFLQQRNGVWKITIFIAGD